MFQCREETGTRNRAALPAPPGCGVATHGSCPKSRDEWHGDVQLKNREVAAGIEQRGRATPAGPREGHAVPSPLWSRARSSKPSPRQFPAPRELRSRAAGGETQTGQMVLPLAPGPREAPPWGTNDRAQFEPRNQGRVARQDRDAKHPSASTRQSRADGQAARQGLLSRKPPAQGRAAVTSRCRGKWLPQSPL